MKELQYNVDIVARLLCKIASGKPELKSYFQPEALQFILSSGISISSVVTHRLY